VSTEGPDRMMLRRVTSDRPLTQVGEDRLEPWRRADWQKLWLATQVQRWRSLALVPAGKGGPPDFTMTIAVSLARTGMTHLGVPIHVADGTRVPLAHLMQFIQEIDQHVRSGDLVLLALAPPTESLTTVSLAQAAHQVMLCVLLDKMNMGDAKKAVDQIGVRQFLGAATFRS
jgi:hypothetical protein